MAQPLNVTGLPFIATFLGFKRERPCQAFQVSTGAKLHRPGRSPYQPEETGHGALPLPTSAGREPWVRKRSSPQWTRDQGEGPLTFIPFLRGLFLWATTVPHGHDRLWEGGGKASVRVLPHKPRLLLDAGWEGTVSKNTQRQPTQRARLRSHPGRGVSPCASQPTCQQPALWAPNVRGKRDV